jgi:hypothetical protein
MSVPMTVTIIVAASELVVLALARCLIKRRCYQPPIIYEGSPLGGGLARLRAAVGEEDDGNTTTPVDLEEGLVCSILAANSNQAGQ